MSKGKLIKLIPNCLTMTNLLLGLSAIIFILRAQHPHKEAVAAGIIVFGGIIDFFDGYLARKLDAVTDFGKQLDSFADLITFGVAPTCLLQYSALYYHPVLITVLSGLFVTAGAFRLARYNLNDFSNHFMGLPITIAGIILVVYCATRPGWAHFRHLGIDIAITTVFIVLLSVMMVSKVKFKRLGPKF